MKRILAVAIVSLAASTSAFAQSATATATASVTFVSPLSITKTADLNFGSIIAGPAGGGITIDPDGGQYPNSVVVLPGGYSNAQFAVSGVPNSSYSIVLPVSAIVSNGDSAYDLVAVDFTSLPSGTGTLSADGTQTLGVGATMHITHAQVPGNYSGTFDVTVMY